MSEQLPAMTLINGAIPFRATHLNGETEEVSVRLVPISKIPNYIDAVQNMLLVVELVCDKPAGWAASLDDDSVFMIDALGRKLNDPRVGRYLERQEAAVAMMVPTARKVSGLMNLLPTPAPVA